MKNNETMSAPSLLGIAFICLKLCNVINWSWWWVLAPFWMPVIFFLVILAVVVLVPLIVAGAYMLTAGVIDLFSKLRK